MYVLRGLSTITILATACIARPTSDVNFNKAVIEKLEAPPIGWVKDASVELDKDTTSITLKVHLVNQDMAKFHDLALNVRSFPGQQHDECQINTT
jgi:tripeptidyl-peptidase-1